VAGVTWLASVTDSSPANGVAPDVSTFLLRLSRTVRDNLAPRAGPGFLEDQLYSLSSILKILGTVAATIDDENEADVLDLQSVLTEISAPDTAGRDPVHPRAALAQRIRKESLLSDPDARVSRVVRGYLERDLARPYVGLLGPSPAAPPSLSSLAASEFTGQEDAARGRLCRHVAGEQGGCGSQHRQQGNGMTQRMFAGCHGCSGAGGNEEGRPQFCCSSLQ